MWVRAREALLRAEYREWYPGIVPGVGYRAAWLASAVLQQLREGSPRWELEPRLPPDRHFIFRGGWRGPRRRRSRREDLIFGASSLAH